MNFQTKGPKYTQIQHKVLRKNTTQYYWVMRFYQEEEVKKHKIGDIQTLEDRIQEEEIDRRLRIGLQISRAVLGVNVNLARK